MKWLLLFITSIVSGCCSMGRPDIVYEETKFLNFSAVDNQGDNLAKRKDDRLVVEDLTILEINNGDTSELIYLVTTDSIVNLQLYRNNMLVIKYKSFFSPIYRVEYIDYFETSCQEGYNNFNLYNGNVELCSACNNDLLEINVDEFI